MNETIHKYFFNEKLDKADKEFISDMFFQRSLS